MVFGDYLYFYRCPDGGLVWFDSYQWFGTTVKILWMDM
jgi:hypothetical protein